MTKAESSEQQRHRAPAPDGLGPAAHSAIGRAMAVINVMRSAAIPLTLTEIGRRAGLAKSTTHRLLNTLVDYGIVRKYGTSYTVIGTAAAGVARDRTDVQLRRLLAPFLSELYVALRKTVSLAVLKDIEVVYLERIHAPAVPWNSIDEQGSAPALATAGGRLLLAYRSGASADGTGSNSGSSGGSGAAPLPELAESPDLKAEFARIRHARYAMCECSCAGCERTVCIAVPILGVNSAPCAAFTATSLAGDLNVTRTLHALWTFATIASEQITRSGVTYSHS